jgi:hypothetical protein
MIPKCSLNGYNSYLQLFGLLFMAIILVAVVLYYLQMFHSNILEKYETESVVPSTINYKNAADPGDRSTYPQDKYPGAKMDLVGDSIKTAAIGVVAPSNSKEDNTEDSNDLYTLRDCKVYFTDKDKIGECDAQPETSIKTCSYKFDGWKEFESYKDNNGATLTYPKKIYKKNASNTNELINSYFTSKCFKEFDNNGKGGARRFEYQENALVKYDSKGTQDNTEIDTNIFGGKKYTSIQFMNTDNPSDNLDNVINSICSITYNTIRSLTGKTFYKFILKDNNIIDSIQKLELKEDQTGFKTIGNEPTKDFAVLGSHGLRYNNPNSLQIFLNEIDVIAKMNIYRFTYVTNLCTEAQIKSYQKYPQVDMKINDFITFGAAKDGAATVNITMNNLNDITNITTFTGQNNGKYIDYKRQIIDNIDAKKQAEIIRLNEESTNNKKRFNDEINTIESNITEAYKRKNNFTVSTFKSVLNLEKNNLRIFNYATGYRTDSFNSIPIPSGAEAMFVNSSDICLIFKNNNGQNQQTYSFVVPEGIRYTCDILIIGGGGGGGMDMGGGGGGGGFIELNNMNLGQGSYTINVGKGGNGAPAGGTNGQPYHHQFTINATQGGNSSFGSYTAIGGGFGGSSYQDSTLRGKGSDGGSGGGGSGYCYDGNSSRAGKGTSGQGNRGGYGPRWWYAGGGGGAGQVGGGPSYDWGGAYGGSGKQSNILGIPFYWAGGGGGSSYSTGGGNGGLGGGGGAATGDTSGGAGYNNGSPGGGGCTNCWAQRPGGNGGPHTGGGGGGGSHYNSNNKGGDGGSGIVIIRIKGIIRIPEITYSSTDNNYRLSPTTYINIPTSRIQISILTSFIYLQKGFYRFRADIGNMGAANPNIIYAELVIYDENSMNGSGKYNCKQVFKYNIYNDRYRPSYLKQYLQISTNKFYKLAYTFYYLNNTNNQFNDYFNLYHQYLEKAPEKIEGSMPRGLIAWFRFNGNIADINSSSTKYSLIDTHGRNNFTNETFQGRRFLNTNWGSVKTRETINLAGKSFSISVWIRPKNNDHCYFICHGDQHRYVCHEYIHIGSRGNGCYLIGFWCNDLEYNASGGRNYPEDVNNWVHMVFVVDVAIDNKSCSRRMYRNGVEIAKDSGKPLYKGRGVLYIGQLACSGEQHYRYNMDISDFLLFDRALTADEVSTLYTDAPSESETLSSTYVSLTSSNDNSLFTRNRITEINTPLNEYLYSGQNVYDSYNNANMRKIFSTISYANNNYRNYQELSNYLNTQGIDYFSVRYLGGERDKKQRSIDEESGKLTTLINNSPIINNAIALSKAIKGIDYNGNLPRNDPVLKAGISFTTIFGNKETDYITYDKVTNLNNLANPGLIKAVYVEAFN